MKSYIKDFFRRGLTAMGFGPLVLAVLFLILRRHGQLEDLTVEQICLGIFSLTALAFIAGGMNAIYQVERLPLMVAILIHGLVLYVSYLITYLINGWLAWCMVPVLVFTGIFLVGYVLIWVVIYSIIKNRTARINAILRKNQQT